MLYNKKNGNIEITVESKGAELKALLNFNSVTKTNKS